MSQPDTKDRILDAAERLFSDSGVASVSLRAITGAAEVNLAAVNYHFGSKDELIKAVLGRRIQPINAERLRRLDALCRGAEPPGLEDLLTALLEPAFELSSQESGGRFCTRLVGRVQSDAEPIFREFCREQFQEVIDRFLAAIGKACPHLSPAELLWRFHFMVGSMAFTMSDSIDLHAISGGACDPRSPKTATEALVRFAAAGFRAPGTAGEELS